MMAYLSRPVLASIEAVCNIPGDVSLAVIRSNPMDCKASSGHAVKEGFAAVTNPPRE
jgi:hypothetical protein